MMDCQLDAIRPVTTVSSEHDPHVDNPLKLFVGMLCFRRLEDRTAHGDLNIYGVRGKRCSHNRKLNLVERFIETCPQVAYGANAVMFPDTEHSLHGTTPRAATHVPRCEVLQSVLGSAEQI